MLRIGDQKHLIKDIEEEAPSFSTDDYEIIVENAESLILQLKSSIPMFTADDNSGDVYVQIDPDFAIQLGVSLIQVATLAGVVDE